MYAVYILGLFGLLAALIGSVTVTQMASSMQQKLSNAEQVRQLMTDFEYAVNSVYLKENLDLRTAGVLGPSQLLQFGAGQPDGTTPLDAMLPGLRWSRGDLLTDPWETAIRYYAYEEPTFLYQHAPDGDPTTVDGEVIAPVVYWVVVSAGPDRAFTSGQDGAGGPPSPTGVLTLNFTNYPQQGDDIVLAFSTLAAMRAHYNNFQAVEDKVASLALKSYRDQVTAFMRTSKARDYMGAQIDDLLGTGSLGGSIQPIDPVESKVAGGEVELPLQQSFGGLEVVAPGFEKPVDSGGGDTKPPSGTGLGNVIIDGQVYRQLLTVPDGGPDNPRDWPRYPHMNFGGDVREGSAQNPVQVRAEDFGAEGEMEADPFFLGANINPAWELLYDPATPWQLVLRRAYDTNATGWLIETERVISGLDSTP